MVEAKDRMIRQGRWKLTYQPLANGPRYALYDLEQDPKCMHDVSAAHPDIVAALREKLVAWLTAGERPLAGRSEARREAKAVVGG